MNHPRLKPWLSTGTLSVGGRGGDGLVVILLAVVVVFVIFGFAAQERAIFADGDLLGLAVGDDLGLVDDAAVLGLLLDLLHLTRAGFLLDRRLDGTGRVGEGDLHFAGLVVVL